MDRMERGGGVVVLSPRWYRSPFRQWKDQGGPCTFSDTVSNQIDASALVYLITRQITFLSRHDDSTLHWSRNVDLRCLVMEEASLKSVFFPLSFVWCDSIVVGSKSKTLLRYFTVIGVLLQTVDESWRKWEWTLSSRSACRDYVVPWLSGSLKNRWSVVFFYIMLVFNHLFIYFAPNCSKHAGRCQWLRLRCFHLILKSRVRLGCRLLQMPLSNK